MKTLKRLWRDEDGGTSFLSTLLLYTVLVLGSTVGVIALRNQIVQEFGDVAAALTSLNQNWQVNGVGFTGNRPPLPDPPNAPPANLSFEPPISEGTPLP